VKSAEETPSPFCRSRRARACFSAWRQRLEALGAELSQADLYVVGVVSHREAGLEELQVEIRRTRDLGLRLKLVEAARRASLAFQNGLELLERTFGARVQAEPAALPVAVGAGGGRVMQFPSPGRPHVLAPRLKGPAAVRARLVTAIANAERAGRPATKDLLLGTQGDRQTILRVLGELVRSGEVRREGRGTRGSSFRYRTGASR
jgi:hypothetical protein